MKPSLEREQRLFDALKRITLYDPPDRLAKRASRDYGLDVDECVEMAYENVLAEARQAIKGMRRPEIAVAPVEKEQ